MTSDNQEMTIVNQEMTSYDHKYLQITRRNLKLPYKTLVDKQHLQMTNFDLEITKIQQV